MALKLTYINKFGKVMMYGGGKHEILIRELAGFGTVEFEYSGAVYAGCDGQKTTSRRALPRALTVSAEVCGENTAAEVRRIIGVLSEAGTLYISDTENGGLERRIYCDRCTISDTNRISAGRLAAFTVQFICDSPYFEDAEDTEIPIYRRVKNLETPFTLPTVFGTAVSQNTAFVVGHTSIEPKIVIKFTKTLDAPENIAVTNTTTGTVIKFDYTPQAGDIVTADIPNRRLVSSRLGDITEILSDDTYLNDFYLIRGRNALNVNVGDVQSGTLVACVFNNKYFEAAVI